LVNITNWVHQNIAYDLSYGDEVYDSLTTLKNKKGVCDELAILEAAFLRARGYPVRYISGVSNTTYDFGLHAWLEVYVPGDEWISVDPTYNQMSSLDASHIILSKSFDPLEVSDKITANQDIDIQFLEKKINYKINQIKSFEELGYNNFVKMQIIAEKKLKSGSLFVIKNQIKNTSATSQSLTVNLYLHDDFRLISPLSNRTIVYLEPFEEKEFDYYVILPKVTNAMRYNFMFVSQISDLEGLVEVYPTEGLFNEAFFVSKPEVNFDNNNIVVNFNVFNYTQVSKNLEVDFNYNGINSKEYYLVLENSEKTISKSFNKIEDSAINISINGDYKYFKTIKIHKSSIKIEDQNLDITTPDNFSDENENKDNNSIWKNIEDKKINEKPKANYKFLIIAIIVFVIIIFMLLLIKPKPKPHKLTYNP
ncbi:MAG: transglutaminase-like domain-containing protein, partial [archaeon]